MTAETQPQRNDRILLTFNSNVVRSVIFLGYGASPVEPERQGALVALTPTRDVVEWVDLAYVKKMEVTLPGGGSH